MSYTTLMHDPTKRLGLLDIVLFGAAVALWVWMLLLLGLLLLARIGWRMWQEQPVTAPVQLAPPQW